MRYFDKKEDMLKRFGSDTNSLGWVFQDNDERQYGKPSKFHKQIEYYYLLRKEKKTFEEETRANSVDLSSCFMWIYYFVEPDELQWCTHHISLRILDGFKIELKNDQKVAYKNLINTLRNTLDAFFDYVDFITKDDSEEDLYFKYLNSVLTMKMEEDIDSDNFFYKFKNEVISKLLIRKEMFQEIISFNKLSKHKIVYQDLKINLDKHLGKSSSTAFSPNHFLQLWNVEKNEVYRVLDDFIKRNPKKYIEKTNEGYSYVIKSTDKINKRLAGLMIAFYKNGWINNNAVEIDAPVLIMLLNNFFLINITDKTPFTVARLANLRDEEHADYKHFVKELMPFILKRNRF